MRDKGRITKKLAEQKAREEYDEFNKTQKITSDFDQAVKHMLEKGDASDWANFRHEKVIKKHWYYVN